MKRPNNLFRAALRVRNCTIVLASIVLMIPTIAALTAAEPAPVAKWDFGTEEESPLRPHGSVHRDVPGPRPPTYPDFAPDNTAIKLDGNGARFVFDDTGAQSDFDFTNGDTITVEAWVQLGSLKSGENLYVIGKGRTGAKGFPADNQNWALRIRETTGSASVSFLFATKPGKGGSHWHRWTTDEGFKPGKSWHHIAASYQFGTPKSIRTWIDGEPQPGKWDMGGETTEPPIVDDDAIWIGSSRGGAAQNSFRGSIDSISIFRDSIGDKLMKSRFNRVGEDHEEIVKRAKEVMPDFGDKSLDRVRFSLHEDMPAHQRWLNTDESFPEETMSMKLDSFLMDRLPQRYDSWGIRETWKAPVLARFAVDLRLSPGEHRFMMRVRGLSRLWVNGEVIARSKPITGSPSGEEPITPVVEAPLPGLRIAEHRQQQVLGAAMIGPNGKCRVVLETLVGAKANRTDPGETLVAIESDDKSTYYLVGPQSGSPVVLSDAKVTAELARTAQHMQSLDDQRRRGLASSRDDYWKMRHDVARSWLQQNVRSELVDTDQNPIDYFIAEKMTASIEASSETPIAEARQFHDEVLPILRDNCFRCHGEKDKGGLLLNSRDAAIKGGDSELPAVVPGDSEKSELVRLISSDDGERMPPTGDQLSNEQIRTLKSWIDAGALWPALPVTAEDVKQSELVDDAAFLRRVYLDVVGVPPREKDVREFLTDTDPSKRERTINKLLADDRWADNWMGYWQDVLAENPTLINKSLNTTGPFRWFLFDAFRDNKSFDRLVTELILLRGSQHEGGSAGFAIAGNNDAPFAAKGQIVASAFQGIELQCARCHDSPYHSTKQSDLYSLAAMFERKQVSIPKTSRVPDEFFEQQKRESLIRVSLKPNASIKPEWPFEKATGVADDESIDRLMSSPADSRMRLATVITAPQNRRFARVIVNRIWRRYIGAGIVEPPDDWEGHAPSHPKLLDWLADEFVSHNYDLKHVARLILNSKLYQREAIAKNRSRSPELRFFAAPDRRRLTAEQIVDSLHVSAGREMNVEELTFDPDARRASGNRLTLGTPNRAWMFASIANERDRPSLGLPRTRAALDIMEAFGWSGSRQNPRTDRETDANVLQPGVLANSVASTLLTRATVDSGIAQVAIDAESPETLIDTIYLRYLSRLPTEKERATLSNTISDGFAERIIPSDEINQPKPAKYLPRVTWSNHLRHKSNEIAIELEQRARKGRPADPRLRTPWRQNYEDAVWSVINLGEFVWVP